jgi:hypothetical protein
MYFSRRTLLALAAAALVSACGGGGDDDHAHTNTVIDTAGRLAIAESAATGVRVFDLDSKAVAATIAMDSAPSALYTSPNGRYAVAYQGTAGKVQFIDGGIWQEDHTDHLHDYKQATAKVDWTLSGTAPSHFDVQTGVQATVYFDGNATATPAQNAKVSLLTDDSIGGKKTAASLDLAYAVHGFGEPVGNKLLTVVRAADATTALPTHLELYQRNGTGYTYDRRLDARCEGMHGSYSSGSHTVVGCLDGVVVVTHTSATAVADKKLVTPLRVTAVVGHPKLTGQFIGIGTEGTTAAPPVTTRFYAIDAAAGTSATLPLAGWDTGRVLRAYAMDRSGTRFAVVDDQGSLRTAVRQSGAWAVGVAVTGVVPTMPTAAPWPAIAVNNAKDEFYVTDPVAKQLVTVNSLTGAVISRTALGFTPSAITWTGIAR